ncbi:MAG: ATP-dependent RecD-like DNA helicase [Verrucomicrobiae bacterium]|nr:ATP-dependent RecD-like DNA helicase [Verrucomicrobiae bacterium]
MASGFPADSNSPPTEIEGEVDSVVFHNDENGYSVLRLAVKGRPGEVETVVGNIPTVNEGERLKARGVWIDDRQYGRQFRADHLQAEAPVTVEGIERFLASGLIEGVGKEYARRIVEKFGTDVFDIIDHASQRLEEIDGIGAKRRRRIKESWKQQRAVRDIMVFLHSHGISAARALRIFKTYGEDAIETLRANPYRLAEDISGIGFHTADEIAGKMGQSGEAPARLRAGIDYVLKQAASSGGHCALPFSELIAQAVEVLGVPEEAIEKTVSGMIAAEKLIEDRIGEARLIFLPEFRAAEIAIAERVRHFTQKPVSYPDIDAEKAIAWFEEKQSFQLGEEQRRAVSEALTRRFLVITGGPGVGKTTIFKAVLSILVRKQVKPVLCAPTGRAAKRLSESTGAQAVTIHRLLEFLPEGGFARGRSRPLEGDLFVIDEASMIDVLLMQRLLEAIPNDGHVLFVGDVDQLPSVGPGRVLGDLIDSGIVFVARLTEIFRQSAASRIIAAAHAVNQGQLPDLDTGGAEADFFFLERNDPESVLQTVVDVVARRLPARYGFDPARDIQVLTPMNRNSLGTENLNAALQAALNPPEAWKFEIDRFGATFRAGDKVIQTRNDYDKEVFNGDIGNIREITTDPARVVVHFDGDREAAYEPGELDELRLAYAITIHKSQGSEFPVVVIPVSTQHFIMLQRNLLYTAITRGKRLVVLIGDRKAIAMAVKKGESQRRWTGLRERLAGVDLDE